MSMLHCKARQISRKWHILMSAAAVCLFVWVKFDLEVKPETHQASARVTHCHKAFACISHMHDSGFRFIQRYCGFQFTEIGGISKFGMTGSAQLASSSFNLIEYLTQTLTRLISPCVAKTRCGISKLLLKNHFWLFTQNIWVGFKTSFQKSVPDLNKDYKYQCAQCGTWNR